MRRSDLPAIPFGPGDAITAHVARVARAEPGRVALVHGESRLSWAEFDAHVDGVARALADHGVTRGDRVAILAANSIPYVEAFFGALRAGCAAVPLPTSGSPDSLSRMLEDSGATALFVDAAHADAARSMVRRRPLLRIGFDFDGDGVAPYAPVRVAPALPVPPPAIAADDAFDVIYSSGTTGIPKGIVHSHGARKASYSGARAAYFSRVAVNVVSTPFYSNTTCITWLLTTAAGGTNVLLGKFSPEAFLSAVERHEATHAMLVPVQYDRILASEAFSAARVSTLKYVFSTSAPLRPDVKRRILDELSAELVEIYGLTEGGPVTVLEARRHPDKLASVGVPSPGCDVRIVDETGHEVPRGQTGEVIGRSANMMSGYLNRPEDTEQIHFRDAAGTLYFRSGDLGRFDEDGFLFLLDRKKDVIISGGFNVYATDLEVVLAAHPAVAEVAVVGVPSDAWGETPLALVVPRAGAQITPESLRDYCNERVGKIQRVSGVELRDALPKNAIGKVLKRELREPYWKGRGTLV